MTKPKHIWIVQGQSGQYSDWRCWVVRAFAKDADAKAFAEKLGQETRTFKQKYPERLYAFDVDPDRLDEYEREKAKYSDPENIDGWDEPNYTAFSVDFQP